ncbi:hypothetical protein B0T20DRAFT_113552 [Sordaria brevicollis]|uniref:BTB domain-containing protein n=1 Tax=Sordaria brevicollis TaxID=83679 RepID=A0AAE0PK75_SORBR|nr:hypothetical protein B0T20DRAFT_113552 [Sordaria brevicollis]
MMIPNADFKPYFSNPLFSDATIIYYTESLSPVHLPVHRLILAQHSSFFKAAFTLPFAESSPSSSCSSSSPSSSSSSMSSSPSPSPPSPSTSSSPSSSPPTTTTNKPTITLHHDPPAALLSSLAWCYGHSLYHRHSSSSSSSSDSSSSSSSLETSLVYKDLISTPLTPSETQSIFSLLLHLVQVYVVADKYDIPGLREEVLTRWDRLAGLVVLSRMGEGGMLEEVVGVGVLEKILGAVMGLSGRDRLRRRVMGGLAREVCTATEWKGGMGKGMGKGTIGKGIMGEKGRKKGIEGKEWEMEEVERIVRGAVFKVRTVGMGKEWKREFMRALKREVRRVVKGRMRGVM